MSETDPAPLRRPYHHGDLKTALLNAAERQIAQKGVEHFTIADAAREAGVSAAAPYRHFKDRADLIGHLAARGFDELSRAQTAARDRHPSGSLDGLIALGLAYVTFVVGRRELFHVMWGSTREPVRHEAAMEHGHACYGDFIETLEAVKAAQGLTHIDTESLGTPLWSMVHGLSSLLLTQTEMLNDDPAHLEAMLARATRAYFAGLKAEGDD